MLQFPTNIYPQNVAFDPTVADDKNKLKFVFNGDILTTANFKIYNYATGEFVSASWYATENGEPWRYNGQEVSFANGTLGDGLSIGNDYVIQMMLTQRTADGLSLMCDMPVVRGKVVNGGSTFNFFIEDKINNIYEWETQNGLNVPTYRNGYVAAGMAIVIGTERKFIVSYNKETGEIITETGFSTAPSKGDSYTIYSNYLVTPQYYFMCRKTPSVSVTNEYDTTDAYNINTIHTSGKYTQTVPPFQESMIKYFNFDLYWSDHDTTIDANWTYIKSSPKIYSQFVDWRFIGNLIGLNTSQYPNILNVSDTYYKVQCNIVTQEGISIKGSDVLHIGVNNSEDAFVGQTLTATIVNEHMPDYIKEQSRKIHQAVVLSFTATTEPDTTIWTGDVYRRDLETNKVVYLGTEWYYFVDYLVPNKGSFEYIFVPREESTGRPYVNAITKTTIDVNMLGYTITSLIPEHDEYDMHFYRIGDCWKFVGEIDDVTITQNTNRVEHIGANNYSSVSMDDVNYASGTLSAMLGAVDCSDKKYKDTINMVKAWREFITKNSIFLLKSQKGDVWVVNITDSPTTSYQEMLKEIPTTFSFSWSECCDLENIFIVRY